MALDSNKTLLVLGMIRASFYSNASGFTAPETRTPKPTGRVILFLVLALLAAVTTQSCIAQEIPAPPTLSFSTSPSYVGTELAPLFEAATRGTAPSSGITPVEASRLMPPTVRPRTIDTRFLLINALHLGAAVADVELTQHCIRDHQCHEANPFMPSSHAGQLSVVVSYVGVATWISHRLKARSSRYWWLSPAGGIAGHTAGLVSGLRSY